MKRVAKVGALILLASATCFGQRLSDGFDYPVGKPFKTEARDGDGYYVAREFGEDNHLGEDWNGEGGGNSDLGDPVYAASNGTVVYAQNAGHGWGNVVIIEHVLVDGSRVRSMYAHLDQILKTSGEVLRGDQIGTIGRGFDYGNGIFDYPAHLHFEIRTDVSIGVGPGYSTNKTGWTDPSDFIDRHRPTFVIEITPTTVSVRLANTQQFTATVPVTWSVNGIQGGNATVGTITASGLYTAPSLMPNPNTVTVTATSVADPTQSASVAVTLLNPIPVLSLVSPTSIVVGPFTLTVNGSNFVSGAKVNFGGAPLPTTFVSSTQLTATGTAVLSQVGSVPVNVTNPDPGSATSNTINVMVVTLVPGSFISFRSDRNNGQFDILVYDLSAQALVTLPGLNDPVAFDELASMSADGRFIAFDSNRVTASNPGGSTDIFLYDRQLSSLVPLSGLNDPSADDVNPVLSLDGRFILFRSNRNGNQFDIFLYDRQASSFVPLPGLNDPIAYEKDYQMTPDGRFIVFASNRLGSQFDVFLYEVSSQALISLPGLNDAQADDDQPSIDASGRFIAFRSSRGLFQSVILIYDRQTGALIDPPGVNGIFASNNFPWLSADGNFLVFDKISSGSRDVFLYDRANASFILLPLLNSPSAEDSFARIVTP